MPPKQEPVRADLRVDGALRERLRAGLLWEVSGLRRGGRICGRRGFRFVRKRLREGERGWVLRLCASRKACGGRKLLGLLMVWRSIGVGCMVWG